MNRSDIDSSVQLLVKCRINNLSSCNPRIVRNSFRVLFYYDFIEWAAHQTVFSIACNSDYEILAALQAEETVVRPQIHRLNTDKVPMFSGGWTWQGFVAV